MKLELNDNMLSLDKDSFDKKCNSLLESLHSVIRKELEDRDCPYTEKLRVTTNVLSLLSAKFVGESYLAFKNSIQKDGKDIYIIKKYFDDLFESHIKMVIKANNF